MHPIIEPDSQTEKEREKKNVFMTLCNGARYHFVSYAAFWAAWPSFSTLRLVEYTPVLLPFRLFVLMAVLRFLCPSLPPASATLK
ncbi:hypothetical protein LY78DRAFT_439599 [Colletotrichum sublineola]|nr:hypothetical protein LY78DRAFT_439599 [Colletotrichum sublineola]